MSRANSFKSSREKRCSGKARLLAEGQRQRREARRERMKAVRQLAPTQANLQRRLKVGLSAKEMALASARLFKAFSHLAPSKDSASVREFVLLSKILNDAWSWIATIGTLAKASASGRISWALSGLEPLIRLSDRRLKLGEALLLLPRSAHEAGVPGANVPRSTNVVLIRADNTALYIQKLREIREADQKQRKALPAPPVPSQAEVERQLREAEALAQGPQEPEAPEAVEIPPWSPPGKTGSA
jgi:hypothetical protein